VVTQLPIYAFEVLVVGPDDCHYADFNTGYGHLDYFVSKGQLCVQSEVPSACAQGPRSTGENSNLTYANIGPPCCGPAGIYGATITGQDVNTPNPSA
jgi:hypothetical protein